MPRTQIRPEDIRDDQLFVDACMGYVVHEAQKAARIFMPSRVRGGSVDDFDDHMQEAFLAALVAREKYDADRYPATQFGTYLTRVIQSHMSNRLASSNRGKRRAEGGVVSMDFVEAGEDEDTVPPPVVVEDWTPENAYRLAQLFETVCDSLDEDELAVFLCVTDPPPGLVDIARDEATKGRRRRITIRVSSLGTYLEMSHYKVRKAIKGIQRKFSNS